MEKKSAAPKKAKAKKVTTKAPAKRAAKKPAVVAHEETPVVITTPEVIKAPEPKPAIVAAPAPVVAAQPAAAPAPVKSEQSPAAHTHLQGGTQPAPFQREGQPPRPAPFPPRPAFVENLIHIEGVLDIDLVKGGNGQLLDMAKAGKRRPSDCFVPKELIRRFKLKQGMMIAGTAYPAEGRFPNPKIKFIETVD